MSKFRGLLRMVAPSATVFFSSGCIMILELVASRLVARDLGSSLYTWTAIIGVVLAGISIGNYAGGRIADRYPARRALAVLFGLASGACVSILILNNIVGDWTWLWRLSWPAHVFAHVSIVFLLPSALLGTIAPVVAKTALDQGLATGRTIGVIYAWGAAGSIVGTFLAGFVLIAAFGSATIIWSIGAAMLVMAILYWISCWAMYLWAMVFAALAAMGMAPAEWAHSAGEAALLRKPSDPNVLYEAETPYCHVAVRQISQRPDRRVFMQDKLKHSEVIMEDVTNLQYFYLKVYAGLTHGLIAGSRQPAMMVIGGGGYAFPRYLRTFWPDSLVEVVEIDPGVTAAAVAAFGMDHAAGIRTIHMDARNYVDQLLRHERATGAVGRYDLIYEDAINDYSVPFQLVTREFNDKIARLLAEDGAYVVNLIDTYGSGQFLGAMVNTLEQTFPHVHVVTSQKALPSLRDTFIVVASKRPLDVGTLLEKHNRHLRFWLLAPSDIEDLKMRCGRVILTDDYAPVENMLVPVVRQSAREILAHKYLDKARAMQSQGRRRMHAARTLAREGRRQESDHSRVLGSECYDQSIEQYRRALELNPSMSIKAHNEIGMMQVEQDKLEEAVHAFRSAVEHHRTADSQEAAIASVHMNLGILLRQMGRTKEGAEELAQAARWFRIDLEENPRSVVAWDRLGDALAITGDMMAASDAFEKAMSLEPGNPSHYEKLARALERQRRYSEAIAVVRKQIELLQSRGEREQAAQVRHRLELLEYHRAKQPG